MYRRSVIHSLKNVVVIRAAADRQRKEEEEKKLKPGRVVAPFEKAISLLRFLFSIQYRHSGSLYPPHPDNLPLSYSS
jgi:hypothetical protein